MAKEDKNFIIRLEGNWKFNIDDNKAWADPDFDDSDWGTIKVPSPWEDQGFNGYDGYAWYRTTFNYIKELKNKDLYLNLGYIGDVDQVFLNGHLIGFSGSFPPHFSPAVDAKRRYPVPENFLNTFGKNVICVRVYNHLMSGGILSGEIGISYSTVKPDVSLSGLWFFRTGDSKRWKDLDYRDELWKKIVVPNHWENQGYLDYNGFAWYRKHFNLSPDLLADKILLVIGNVYQVKEVYINGKLIGSSVKNQENNEGFGKDETRQKCRIYTIPKSLLHSKQNLIAIRVYNSAYQGGIAEGPVGFFKSSTYSKYSKELNSN